MATCPSCNGTGKLMYCIRRVWTGGHFIGCLTFPGWPELTTLEHPELYETMDDARAAAKRRNADETAKRTPLPLYDADVK